MDPRDQFHLGIVTDDVDVAMALLSDSLAYEWGPVITSQVVVRLSDVVAGDSARLADLGYVEEAGAGRWSYYRHPSGLRLELIDRTLAGPMAALCT